MNGHRNGDGLRVLTQAPLTLQLSENLYTQMSVRNKPLSTVGRAFFSQGFPSVCGQINCEEVLTHFKIWGKKGTVVVKNGSHARMRKDAGSWLHPAPSPVFTGCGLIWRLEGMVFC